MFSPPLMREAICSTVLCSLNLWCDCILFKKTYVEAVVDIDPDGRQRPLAIYWGDGRCFVVDRVLESRRAASMKVGGHGIRYTVEICGRTKHLWHSDDGRWYVEEIVPGNAGAL